MLSAWVLLLSCQLAGETVARLIALPVRAGAGHGVAVRPAGAARTAAARRTTIDLCLSLFPWAQFRRRKSAVKLHTLLDLRAAFRPVFM